MRNFGAPSEFSELKPLESLTAMFPQSRSGGSDAQKMAGKQRNGPKALIIKEMRSSRSCDPFVPMIYKGEGKMTSVRTKKREVINKLFKGIRLFLFFCPHYAKSAEQRNEPEDHPNFTL